MESFRTGSELEQMKIAVEFAGGLELLMHGGKKEAELDFGEAKEVPLSAVCERIASELVKERTELFLKKGQVRAGILVLINDVDWELEGGMKYTAQDKDHIAFISTLHGG